MPLPDGGFLAAGGFRESEDAPEYPALVRLLANGEPDATFGRDGVLELPAHPGPGLNESVRAIVPAGGERFLLAGLGHVGYEGPQSEQFALLAEVSASGSLDPAFGHGGVIYLPARVSNSSAPSVALARESDGTVILSAEEARGPAGGQATVRAFSTDGAPDSAFGDGGVRVIPLLEGDARSVPAAIALDSHGDIYPRGGRLRHDL